MAATCGATAGRRVLALTKIHLLLLLSAIHLLTLPATALTATWNAATDIPVTAPAYTATGNDITFTLNLRQQRPESGLLEMPISRERIRQFHIRHHHERYAVRQ